MLRDGTNNEGYFYGIGCKKVARVRVQSGVTERYANREGIG